MLNVVNFGAGTYVLYAEIGADGTIEVDPEPYGDSFARPARLLPVEAKALVAAIDLIGEHIPEGSLASVPGEGRRRARRGPGPRGTADRHRRAATTPRSRASSPGRSPRAGCCRSSTTRRTRTSSRTRTVEPYALINGREGWYLASFDPARDDVRHFRLDRIKSAAVTDETLRAPRPTSTPPPTSTAGRAPARCRRPAAPACGSRPSGPAGPARSAPSSPSSPTARSIVELGFAGVDWLVREVLKEAGDAVVLEPAEAREAVRDAAAAIADGVAVGG